MVVASFVPALQVSNTEQTHEEKNNPIVNGTEMTETGPEPGECAQRAILSTYLQSTYSGGGDTIHATVIPKLGR